MGLGAGRHSGSGYRVGRTVLAYVVLAGLWILLSDLAAAWLWPGDQQRALASMAKGMAFVLVTGGLLGGLLWRDRERVQRRNARQVATTAALLDHFRALSARVSDAVLLVGEDGRIIEANEAATKLLGWHRGALCERRIGDLEIEMRSGPGGGHGNSYEAHYRLADGRILPARVDVLTLQVGQRPLRQFIVRDANRAQAGEGGHRDRAWMDAFFDMPFIGMAISSPSSRRWIRFNDRLCEILGHTREEMARLTWAEMTHPDDLDKDEAEFQRVLRGEIDGYRLEKRFVRRDGSVVHTEMDVRCRRLPDGAVDYFVCTVQDVTDFVEAVERLRRQKNLYAALSRINTAITRLPTREQIFQDVCDAVVAIGRFKFAWVLTVDVENGGYRFETQAGEDGGFVSSVLAHGGATASIERTAPAKAARGGHAVICDPYHAEPDNAPWLEFAEAAGVAASGAFPVRCHGTVVGVLNVYSRRSGDFDADTVALIEEMVRDVSFALENRLREDARGDALKALRAAEARARFALEGAGHGAWEWDLGTGRVTYSPAWKRMLGYEEHEISDAPQEWRDRIHPEDAEATMAGIEAHLAGRTPSYVSEHRLRCKDGSYKWILDRGQVLERTEDGRPAKVFGTKTDMSEVKSAEERLRQERQRMAMARASARIGSWDFDMGGGTVHWHRHCGSLFGLGAEPRSLSFEEYADLLHPDDREAFTRAMDDFRRDGGDYHGCFRFTWPDGSIHWIEHRGVMYRDEAGRPGSAFGISMDVVASSPSSIRTTVDLDAFPGLESQLDALVERLSAVANPVIRRDVAVVSVVGEQVSADMGRIFARIGALPAGKVMFLAHAADDHHMSWVVDATVADDLVRLLHDAVFADREAEHGPTWSQLRTGSVAGNERADNGAVTAVAS